MLPLLVLTALLFGCGTVQKIGSIAGTNGGWYAVTADHTPFYKYGPQQGSGPDQQLAKDSIMKVIRPSFGYVKVKLQDGEDGYVASEDIRPAPVALVAEKLSPPPSLVADHSGQGEQGEQFQLNSNDPRLIAPPEPLPEASPTPTFRY